MRCSAASRVDAVCTGGWRGMFHLLEPMLHAHSLSEFLLTGGQTAWQIHHHMLYTRVHACVNVFVHLGCCYLCVLCLMFVKFVEGYDADLQFWQLARYPALPNPAGVPVVNPGACNSSES